jgi:hypothetical protein
LPARGCAFFEREPGSNEMLDWHPVVPSESPAVWASNNGTCPGAPWSGAP